MVYTQVSAKAKTSKAMKDFNKNKYVKIVKEVVDKYAIETYLKHFPEHKNFGDATKINPRELPEFDMLCGGFPCQSFSLTGKRMGFKDTRGTLFFEIARIVKERKPQIILLENVKGLLSHDEGRTFAIILATLDELGYNAEWQVINGRDFGVCQDRKRIFIVAYNRESGKNWQQIFPIRGYAKADYVLQTLTARYFASNSNGNFICYPKERWKKMRRLTPLECERLQGFPDNWTEGQSDSQRYKQIGNAVIPNIIERITSGEFHSTETHNRNLTEDFAKSSQINPKD